MLRPEHPASRSLSQLVTDFGFETRERVDSVEVSGVTVASSSVEPGDLYVGLPGRRAHGASFASEAARAGAAAVLTDAAGADLAAQAGIPVVVTDEPRAVLGDVASWIYRTQENPATLFAVTGTNGKTSVVYMIAAVLEQLGIRAGLSSTAERRIGDLAVTSSLTTPEASELHGLLARMRESEVRAAAVEVSAQALSRHRVDGIVFDVVGFTNLSHDHLDDYGSMDEYYEAKLALFDPDRARRGVVTVDTGWGRRLADESRIPVTTLSMAPGAEADWRVELGELALDRTGFTLHGPDGRSVTTSIPVLGSFMAANAALAIVMLVESGYDLEAIGQALDRDGGIQAYIPGRAERVSGENGPAVFVDYGHTPDAFVHALASLREVTKGRIIMVFGADGDRDTTKRGDMGAIAARGADEVIITDFHPRYEDPAAIRAALIAGALDAVPDAHVEEIADQRAAIRAAIARAGDDDVIFYAGPGHEDYQEVAGVQLPYSARDDVRLALREAGLLS
ncbi:UDP-N-acetylmuramoyl-L-alanyl-D-glutamate--2,6-diaminopimelate ligase [Humibacter albus]|jgi:UDP-N-acetylmuramoyl-L-alanyl-D-glutamate--2,6-diaminopimelate ligase|uniref:UDP-N-acetylmuramoyl-L-alanyl-D-glutamate--2, 6-diaminopimelate ligase n=1 Tax=Humibacter albus TaxID=427754 RepID=UPI0003B691DD|nr:UDP-N-acetylmuramoyl-L-alanyl-D-glutamate--2,6-diaminopimelate ligase [Humibacter albus]